jgi:molybdopterin-synthase adenylyltransferase
MSLTDNQIERYSRQIIVPGVGGSAQERLLASCVAIVAEPADAANAVAYLAGAGVGRIMMHPVGDRASYPALVVRTRDLNPDVSVRIANDASSAASDDTPSRASNDAARDESDLTLALIGDARAAEAVAHLCRARRCAATIIARLDAPGRIAILPASPPCPLCAEGDLLSPPGARAGSAGVIAMVAVTEAFRLLAGVAGQHPEAVLVEFDGYVSQPRALGRRRASGGGRQTPCVCEALS